MYDLAEYPPYLAPCFPSYLNEKILAGIDLVPGENEIIKYSHTVQFSHSVMSDSLWPQGLQHARHPCPTPTPGVLLKLMSIESVMPSNHLILCHSLLLLPSIFQSIRVFSNESVLHTRWLKYWSFSFSISPSKEHSGLISFRMDWLDLLAVQGTLKSLLQHHSSKASILWRSAFFIVQLSHPYMTTGKTIASTRWTFVGKVMSLLLNMLSRLVITFLPRSKRLLISWLQSPAAVILEPKKIKSDTVSTVSPSISHEVMGPDAMIFVFWMLSFKPIFSLSTFTFIKSRFRSSSLSAIRVVSSAYLRLLIFLPAILIPACLSSSPAFLMMYSAYKLNKQGDNIQPWRTPFPIWNQSVVLVHKFLQVGRVSFAHLSTWWAQSCLPKPFLLCFGYIVCYIIADGFEILYVKKKYGDRFKIQRSIFSPSLHLHVLKTRV